MKVTIDASAVMAEYTRAFRTLKKLEGFDQLTILRAEAGVILKTWAGRTPIASPRTTELFARTRAAIHAFGGSSAENRFGITVNTGRRQGTAGMVWFRTNNKKWQTPGVIYSGGFISQNHLHFSDDDWARIESGMVAYSDELKKALPAAQKARGLGRQSVIQIADDLGIDLGSVAGGGSLSAEAIAKARAAIASNGSQYKNGTGAQGGDEVKCFIDLSSRYPFGMKIGMDAALLQIIANRVKFIETAYRKGAFDSMGRAAKSFPNVFKTVQLQAA